MLELINLVKKFGTFTAVENLNLKIEKGEFFGFIGQNGAGKTTTIKMITGLYTPTAGTVLIDDIDIAKEPVKAKSITGYIPDQPFIYEKLTGREFLLFCGGLYNIPRDILKLRIDEAVEYLSIGDWLDKRTEEYSQGMKQRIIIASGLLHNPKLLVIDEPMIGLDPQSALSVKKTLVQKAKEGCAILMSTHSLHIAEEICTTIGIIKDGRLIYSGPNTHDTKLETLFLELTQDE